ncbi:MAG: hypothetical protein JRG80_05890 [Deltaproteobacteria bacterium]|nr:hypothetical protein [Deltaproteobacteria bacterium]
MGVQSVIAHARRRFLAADNILAIGRGLKRAGSRTLDVPAVIFYVRKKGPNSHDAGTRIPRMLYDRDASGSVDRSRWFRTDVREVGTIELVSSGRQCSSSFRKGTASLVFDAPGGISREVYALTCAHVIGDVHRGTPGFSRVKLRLPGSGYARGSRLHQISQRNGRLEFDIAIARLDDQAPVVPLRGVPRDGTSLARFMKPPLPQNRRVKILGYKTGIVKSGRIVGPLHTPVPIAFDAGALLVRNLYVIEDFTPKSGDSGGIVYARDRAVGLVVAKFSRGGCLFHSLYSATKRLFRNSSLDFDVDQIF